MRNRWSASPSCSSRWTDTTPPPSPGVVTFASVFPGLLISPLAGALLDRHGRIRLVLLDYVVALLALVLIGGLALLDALPGALLVLIAIVSSLTAILSHVGLRSLFPILVPEHLWERVNAVDSNGYVVATIIGPPAAAALVVAFGGAVALIVIGLAFGIAAVALVGVPDPPAPTVSSKGNLLVDAWDGLVYTWRNPTLRGLGFAISFINLAFGMTTIVLPLIVLDRFGLSEAVVGPRLRRLWHQRRGIGLPLRPDGHAQPRVGAPRLADRGPGAGHGPPAARGRSDADLVAAGPCPARRPVAPLGLLVGPTDIALFTVRQRRTDPAWMGRAFSVSMAFNYLGVPIGAAVAGHPGRIARSSSPSSSWASAATLAAAAAARLPGATHRCRPRGTGGAGDHDGVSPAKRLTVRLVTTGRQTGKAREATLYAFEDGERLVIVGSRGGAAKDPAWAVNLRAESRATIRRGSTEQAMRAREATGSERERLWDLVCEAFPLYANYQRRTTRTIPLFVLELSGVLTLAGMSSAPHSSGGGRKLWLS